MSWNEEVIQRHIVNYSTEKILQKMKNYRYFSSVIRENDVHGKWRIIAAFESLVADKKEKVETIHWILVDKKFQNMWFATILSYDFIMYCREKNREKILSFVESSNISSLTLHRKLNFHDLYEVDGMQILMKEISGINT